MLRADSFSNGFLMNLQQLRKDQELLDCKLIFEMSDGLTKEFMAHKIVLSITSNFFKEKIHASDHKVRVKFQ